MKSLDIKKNKLLLFPPFFVSDINGQFFDLITRYTGVLINVEGFSVIDG